MEYGSIRAEVEGLLAKYLRHFVGEHHRFGLLQRQLASGENLFIRSNMTGHLTSSVAVLNPGGTKILLIEHAFLRKWLTPGGHYEGGTVWESALREVREETGVADAQAHPWSLAHGIPLDIDSHDIPANPAKGEGPHVHHDFQFLAVAPEHLELQAQLEEVHAAKWAPVEQLASSTDSRVRRVLEKLHGVGAIPRWP
ncbi:NUDIX hydrolase [Methylibium rhizosphaerae]|uniref:NUDIX hydrolase n=1 Tax=Methylibium rhizosphaerae TaxID=2570323 RepID=UPI00112ECC3F|nr:NUDIX domain-containing protein [Methylibium rhizosphaerae]